LLRHIGTVSVLFKPLLQHLKLLVGGRFTKVDVNHAAPIDADRLLTKVPRGSIARIDFGRPGRIGGRRRITAALQPARRERGSPATG